MNFSHLCIHLKLKSIHKCENGTKVIAQPFVLRSWANTTLNPRIYQRTVCLFTILKKTNYPVTLPSVIVSSNVIEPSAKVSPVLAAASATVNDQSPAVVEIDLWFGLEY